MWTGQPEQPHQPGWRQYAKQPRPPAVSSSGRRLQADRSAPATATRCGAQALVSGNHTDSLIGQLAGLKHRSLSNGGVVPVSSRCPSQAVRPITCSHDFKQPATSQWRYSPPCEGGRWRGLHRPSRGAARCLKRQSARGSDRLLVYFVKPTTLTPPALARFPRNCFAALPGRRGAA